MKKSNTYRSQQEVELTNPMLRSRKSTIRNDSVQKSSIYEQYSINENFDLNIDDIEKALFLAKICIENERWEDAIKYVDEFAQKKEEEFSEEERDVFVLPFKNYISDKRSNWRQIYLKEEEERRSETDVVT